MGGVPRPQDFMSRLERLERDVGNLQRQSTLTSASIGSGGLTVRDNGSIRGLGTGLFDWQGSANFGGNTHIGGDLVIDGNTTLGGNLTFGNNVIPPESLARRVEAATSTTSGEGNTSGSGANNRTLSVPITVPTWAQTVSVIAFGISNMPFPGRLTSSVTIAGNTGSLSETSSTTASNVTAAHGRTFAAAGNFDCSVTTGAPGVTGVSVGQTLVVMSVFTKTT